jgi:hypothetical protein
MTTTGWSSDRRKYRYVVLLAVLSAIAILFVIAIFVLFQNYEVVRKGNFLPYTNGFIYEVLLFDTFTVYAEPEVVDLLDLINGYLLVGAAFAALTFAVIVIRGGVDERDPRLWFFVTIFVGLSYLVADEWLGIHESIGHNLQFLRRLPFGDRPDDLIILAYGFPALLFLLAFRKLIWGSAASRVFFALAFVAFAGAAVADGADFFAEEILECLPSLLIVAAVISLGVHHTKPRLEPIHGAAPQAAWPAVLDRRSTAT